MISQLGYLFMIRRKVNNVNKVNKVKKSKISEYSNTIHNKKINYSKLNFHIDKNDNRISMIYNKEKCLNCNGINYYNKKFCSLDCKSSFILKSSKK